MAPKKPLLEQMRLNPKADWDINAIKNVCAENGVDLQPPSGGSHYKAVSEHLSGHLTIPYNRPIKPYYVKQLVGMIHLHRSIRAQKEKE